MRTKHQLKIAEKLKRKPPGKFQKVDLLDWPERPLGLTRCWKNNRYLVMCYDNAETTVGPAIKVFVQRHDDKPIRSWRAMQDIKNELFGHERMAIEYFPKESELIDDANIYWLWIFPDGVLPTPKSPRS